MKKDNIDSVVFIRRTPEGSRVVFEITAEIDCGPYEGKIVLDEIQFDKAKETILSSLKNHIDREVSAAGVFRKIERQLFGVWNS